MRFWILLVTVATMLGAQPLAASQPTPRVSTANLEAFIDGLAAEEMSDGHPSAIMLALVNGDDQVAKAYGVIDPEGRTPRPADQTSIFRFASISKLFVWMSVLKLAEEGQVDLDADVNTYLTNVKIPATFDAPVTLRHLMHHRAGFETTSAHFLDPRRHGDRARTIRDHMPSRVVPAGERIIYSNFGAELAALIVQEVSAVKFEDYVKRTFWQPMGLVSATYSVPNSDYPAPLSASLKKRFVVPSKKGGTGAVRDEYSSRVTEVAQGGIGMDARDAVRFTRFLLTKGKSLENPILSDESWDLLTDRNRNGRYSHGMGLAMVNGAFSYGHEGGNEFSSSLMVFPDLGIGILASAATSDRSTGVYEWPQMIARRAMGIVPGTIVERASWDPSIRGFSGRFLTSRRSFTMPDKFVAMSEVMTATAMDDGLVKITYRGRDTIYRPLGSDRYADDVGGTISVVRDASGEVTQFDLGAASFNRITWWQTQQAFKMALAAVALLSITTLLGAWYRIGRSNKTTDIGRKLRLVPIVTAILWLAVIVSFVLLQTLLQPQIGDPYPPPVGVAAITFGSFAVAASAILMLTIPIIWLKSVWGLWRRLHVTIYAAALIPMVAVLDFWNAFGRPFHDFSG